MRFLTALAAAAAAALGWLLGRRTAAQPPRDPDIMLPHVPPPTPGTQLMVIHHARKLTGGKALRVTARHYMAHRAVPGVDVRLLHAVTGQVLASGTTDAAGVATITTPTVTDVVTCDVVAEKAGHAFYIPAEDMRAWRYQQGFHPRPSITLWPGATVPAVPANSPKIVIDVGFGWIGDFFYGSNYDALEAKAGASGWEFTEDGWADRDQICDNLRSLGPDDVWVFSGHGGPPIPGSALAQAIRPWRPAAALPGGRYQRMLPDEICRCFGPNGAPGVIFLDACGSAGLIDALVACCAKTVLGWDGNVNAQQSNAATREFFISMLEGRTLGESIDTANGIMQRGFSFSSAPTLLCATKPWIRDARGLTLEELLAAREETEDDG